jgi:serine/threonine-protein kinase HipA
LRLVRRNAGQAAGVSLSYSPAWLGKGVAQGAAQGIALSEDLPLQTGEFLPTEADAAAGAVDDARPDRWGERVIRLLDRPLRLSTLDFLYFCGDDRFGALGVSASALECQPWQRGPLPALADTQMLHDLIRKVEAGEAVEERLRRLVAPGATLGGARPKALLADGDAEWVLKFSDADDPIDSPLIEHATMTLAALAGVDVCETRPVALRSGHAVAVRRFDRLGQRRLHALSAHVALRAAGEPFGYPELALLLRRRARAEDFAAQGEQLFRRMVFNILIDNTDDHEKNHALIVGEDQRYRLSPAFDVLPAGQALGYQQMRVGRSGAESTLDNALSEHRAFALTRPRAETLCTEVAQVVVGWQRHFAAQTVSARDIALLADQIDRPFLREQREVRCR